MRRPPDPAMRKQHASEMIILRSLDRKLDVVVDALQRQGERLARVERDIGETRRDIIEVKSDIALLENKMLTAQTEILAILHRLDHGGDQVKSEE